MRAEGAPGRPSGWGWRLGPRPSPCEPCTRVMLFSSIYGNGLARLRKVLQPPATSGMDDKLKGSFVFSHQGPSSVPPLRGGLDFPSFEVTCKQSRLQWVLLSGSKTWRPSVRGWGMPGGCSPSGICVHRRQA